MIAMQMGQKKALNPDDASFSEELHRWSFTFDTFTINDGVIGCRTELGLKDYGITKFDVEYMDSKHLFRS